MHGTRTTRSWHIRFFFSQSMYVTNYLNLKVACGIFSNQISQALALALDCHATWTTRCSPGHWKTFNSTPDLYPLDVNSIPPLRQPKSSLLLLLLSHFSRVRLCVTPWTAAYQALDIANISSIGKTIRGWNHCSWASYGPTANPLIHMHLCEVEYLKVFASLLSTLLHFGLLH